MDARKLEELTETMLAIQKHIATAKAANEISTLNNAKAKELIDKVKEMIKHEVN